MHIQGQLPFLPHWLTTLLY